MPILTDHDAREVMELHFGAPLSRATLTDGIYTIELGPVFGLGGPHRDELSARSTISYEAALQDLAARRPDLVEMPLTDPNGAFVAFARHRTELVALFDIRTAPLTLADCRRIDVLCDVLPRLRAALRTTVEASVKGLGVFNVEVYAQFMLHRTMALADGAAAAWNARNLLASAVLARAGLETIGVWAKATADAQRHLDGEEYDKYDGLMWRLFFGSRDPSSSVKSILPIHVLDGVRELEKAQPGIQKTYEHLSEIAHPNSEGMFLIGDWQEVGSVSIDPDSEKGMLLSHVLAALRLDVAETLVARWEQGLAAKLARLWQVKYPNAGSAP